MLTVIDANDVGQPRFRARPVIGILRTWQIDGVADAQRSLAWAARQGYCATV
jgi:hypothetical protein